jgi:putative PIN family toxin of toxin-antitoxin system
MIRAVLDTNELLRMAAGGARSQLAAAWHQRRFELTMSLGTLTELRAVLSRPAIQKYVGPVIAELYLSLIEQRASFVQPNLDAPTCRDPGDTVLIATAVGGHVDYLVTADLDLLDDPDLIADLANRGVQVVRAADFLFHLRSLPATEQGSKGNS